MGRGLQVNNPTVVSAFHAALRHQGLVLLLVLAVLAVAWNVARAVQYRHVLRGGPLQVPARVGGLAGPRGALDTQWREPSARRFLRIGFAVLWIFDGVLQAQAAMPLGLPSGVLRPAAVGSPAWVRALDNFAATMWSRHPVQVSAAAVWVQLGLGALLLVAPRGRWSRLAGVASVAWGLVVWVFGEAFGGIFAPGLSWMFGAPGAVLFYCLAGMLLALPERAWRTPTLGRRLVAGMGLYFIAVALLQAWPGRGFWQGHTPHGGGTLQTMVAQMSTTSQPGFLASWLRSFAAFDAAHGFAVNVFVVVALAAIGAALCTRRPALVRGALVAAVVLCLADWVLVEDLGFLGGVGTDPNSMVPILMVLATGYLALVRVTSRATWELPVGRRAAGAWGWLDGRTPGYLGRAFATVGAIAVVVLGAAPMALASANPHADPIVAEALDGTPDIVDFPAPHFTLVDQAGRVVSLTDLRGRTVALTFLDPVCTSDCPIIAQEFRAAARMVDSRSTEFVAVVANPVYNSVATVDSFDRQEGLDTMSNWLYLTGTPAQLQQVWNDYSIQVAIEPGGAMVAHTELAYVIDASGRVRAAIDADPGSDAVSQSSFVDLLTAQLRRVLPR